MPTFEEIRAYQSRKQQEKIVAQQNVLRRRRLLGVALSVVQGEPKWTTFANHLQALKEQGQLRVNVSQGKLSGPEFLDPKEYGQLKLDISDLTVYVRGLSDALNLIGELIKQGKMATEALKEGEQNAGTTGKIENAG